ncbi:hypothetical protein [Sandaracinobacteroides hominis]|uniref:hypothetical protein n=1 Tax=Sandaracinobacteroides hominis TaxID=2780086 RepID=UPI0018F2C92E|nr:hypothetical protein [Sandaracinobacteroides hominis]
MIRPLAGNGTVAERPVLERHFKPLNGGYSGERWSGFGPKIEIEGKFHPAMILAES